MLTSCPKCGFSQPKDQYCAQCGVDMLAYRPPEKTFSQKLSESLFVQLSLVVLVGLFAIYMITKNQKESFWGRVQFLRGHSTQISQSQDANQFSSPQAQEENTDAVESQGQAVAAATVSATTKSSNPQAKIYYLEIPQSVLNKWLEEGVLTRVETSDEVTIGYIPQLTNALEQYKTQIKVLKQDAYNYSLNQLYTAKLEKAVDQKVPSTAKTRAIANTNPEVTPPGLVTYATLDDDRNDTLSGQVEVSVSPQSSYPAQFEMTSDQSFFISGFDRSRTADKSNTTETVVVFKIDK